MFFFLSQDLSFLDAVPIDYSTPKSARTVSCMPQTPAEPAPVTQHSVICMCKDCRAVFLTRQRATSQLPTMPETLRTPESTMMRSHQSGHPTTSATMRSHQSAQHPSVTPTSQSHHQPAMPAPSMNQLASHPMFYELQAALMKECVPSKVPSSVLHAATVRPQEVPVSVRDSMLQMRFLKVDKVQPARCKQLHDFYKIQTCHIEGERYQTLMKYGGVPHLRQHIMENFDAQHNQLIDRISQSLNLLEAMVAPPTSSASSSSMKRQSGASDLKMKQKKQRRNFDGKALKVMSDWYANNRHYPYPSHETAEKLGQGTGLSAEQVKKWFSNRRMRSGNTKPLNEIAMIRNQCYMPYSPEGARE